MTSLITQTFDNQAGVPITQAIKSWTDIQNMSLDLGVQEFGSSVQATLCLGFLVNASGQDTAISVRLIKRGTADAPFATQKMQGIASTQVSMSGVVTFAARERGTLVAQWMRVGAGPEAVLLPGTMSLSALVVPNSH